MSKPSAIKRELDIVIVLNNDNDNDKKDEIEEELRETLVTKCDRRIVIKDRKNQTDDIYKEILDYMIETQFCEFKDSYMRKRYKQESIYYSDFIIFINDGFVNDTYKPMCIAFIKIYEQPHNNNKFLYILLFCSNRKMGQCGSFLMNIIKYVATLLNCNEIRLDSVSEKPVYNFYNSNGFINKNAKPKVDYSHYYPIQPVDAVFKPAETIRGEVSIIRPWYMSLLEDEGEGESHRGKTKRSTLKKSGGKRKRKRKRSTLHT